MKSIFKLIVAGLVIAVLLALAMLLFKILENQQSKPPSLRAVS